MIKKSVSVEIKNDSDLMCFVSHLINCSTIEEKQRYELKNQARELINDVCQCCFKAGRQHEKINSEAGGDEN